MVKAHLLENLWDDYGAWILDRVGFRKKRYDRLVLVLHSIPFTFSIDLDENRAADGLDLRDEFALEMGFTEVNFDRKCSVLEMLAGLAIRIEYEYTGDPKEEHPERIFWEMVENLFDLEHNWRRCQDPYFDQNFVKNRVQKWLKREFRPNGYGSIFPLKRTNRDQRKLEIWSQMNEYLMENYPF